MRLIDISVAIDNTTPADPPALSPSISYIGHSQGAQDIAAKYSRASRPAICRTAKAGPSRT